MGQARAAIGKLVEFACSSEPRQGFRNQRVVGCQSKSAKHNKGHSTPTRPVPSLRAQFVRRRGVTESTGPHVRQRGWMSG
jgi:hypothetical protein